MRNIEETNLKPDDNILEMKMIISNLVNQMKILNSKVDMLESQVCSINTK